MAIASWTTTFAQSNKIWRTIEADVADQLPAECEEFDSIEEFTEDEGTPLSAYSTQIPLNVHEGFGVSSTTPGGAKPRPSSVNVERLTITMNELRKSFATPMLTMWADKSEAQIRRELKHHGMTALTALGNDFGDRFHGTSTGVLALTDSDLSGGTDVLTLYDGYGISTIDDGAYLCDKYRVGDYVAAILTDTLITDAVGVITAITVATPSISVTWQGSASETTNGIKIVKANALEVLTAADTDYNKSFEGLAAITRATSVHGLSGSSVPAWTPAFADATGGRIDGVRLQYASDEVGKFGGKITHMTVDQAVRRDWMDSERSQMRHNSPVNMETDGSIKSGTRKIISNKRCEPGALTGWQKGALKRWTLLPKPDGKFSWGDGMESENYSRMIFNMPMPAALVCRARKHFAYFTGLDRHGV